MNSDAPLTPEEAELWHLLEHEQGDGDSILAYIPIIEKRYKRPTHLAAVADAIYRAAKLGDQRTAISVPPRHGKSETLLHAVPWFLSRDPSIFPFAGPDKTIAYVSYEANFARAQSRKALDAARVAGLVLRRDVQALGEWRTPEGGGLIATGIGGPLTGRGVNLGILDDPFKNRAEAESPVIRQKVWDWLTSTFLTRIEPGGSVLINMARWHDDDVIGRVVKKADELGIKYDVINLPAISDAGEPLWPERWPLKYLDIRRREVGPYDWASLFCGKPRPKGGRMFREPARYRFADVDGARIIIGGDPAATAKTSSHPSAAVVLAVKERPSPIPGEMIVSADVLEVLTLKVEIPALVRAWVELAGKWRAPIYVEAVAGFKGVPQMMREISNNKLVIVDVDPRGDKFTRASPVAAAWNDGRVRVPFDSNAHGWVAEFLSRVGQFTGVGDDIDEVDALSHAWNESTQVSGPRPAERGVY